LLSRIQSIKIDYGKQPMQIYELGVGYWNYKGIASIWLSFLRWFVQLDIEHL
jgi:hypothetical protein